METPKKVYDLEERTARFAERVRDFCLKLPKNAANNEYVPQLMRAGVPQHRKIKVIPAGNEPLRLEVCFTT